jgi:hypothetical protein
MICRNYSAYLTMAIDGENRLFRSIIQHIYIFYIDFLCYRINYTINEIHHQNIFLDIAD